MKHKPYLYNAPVGTWATVPEWGFRYRVFSELFPLPCDPQEMDIIRRVRPFRMKPILPTPERREKWDEFTLDLGIVRSKATIEHTDKVGKIRFDSELWDELEPYQRLYIILHELGHKHYHNETKCDIFALKQMMKAGFPQSVCFDAQESTRDIKNPTREGLVQFFNKTKQHYEQD